MPSQTVIQKDAMERLHEAANPGYSQSLLRDAEEAWNALYIQIREAIAEHNPLLSLELDELINIFKTHKRGTNHNGWKNPYPIDDPRSLLTQYQFISHHDESPNVCDIWSRQTGKGFTIGILIGERCFKRDRNYWTITSPSEKQSLLTLEKCRDAVEAYGLMIDDYDVEKQSSNPQSMITKTKITLSNKSVIVGLPGLASTLRGGTSNLVIDEGDHIENPQEFMRAVVGLIANEMAGKKQIRYITTPLGKNAPSYQYFHDPQIKDEWSCRRLNIWQAVLMGIKQDPYRLLKLNSNDPEGWAQEYLCEWIDNSSVLLPYELINACESDSATMTCTTQELSTRRLQRVAGIDFGRVSDPTVMVLAERALGSCMVRHIEKIKGQSTPVQVQTLLPHLRMCDRVCVDYTGPGVGFGDLLVQELGEYKPEKHLFGKVELCTFTLPFKRDIFPALRTAFERQAIKIPVDQWLREDLHAMAQVISNGQYNYKAPRTDDGHSDGCTALALMERANQTCGGPSSAQSLTRSSYETDLHNSRFERRMGRANGF